MIRLFGEWQEQIPEPGFRVGKFCRAARVGEVEEIEPGNEGRRGSHGYTCPARIQPGPLYTNSHFLHIYVRNTISNDRP
ncbi:MAG: hypothetical protein CVV30_02525 [Methanomicrobiales archaeon HGW-Methanomicrobiales-1]|jgi:hypothetical protein|nr:MAG: hypothetical protein CVV30_02525 [Methanomicrobiales archaeon HGW-Methanomicrobiales-1]